MLTLGIDTTAGTASVALLSGETMLGEYTLNSGNTHSQTLLPMIEHMLARTGKTPKDIELYACAAGPGSFTGVRIGAATVKGLAAPWNTPCVPVSALEALAQNLAIVDGRICPVMNARRGQVYTALFESSGGALHRTLPDAALSLGELEALLREADTPVYFVGDGYDLTEPFRKTQTPERLRYQSAASVALLGQQAYLASEDKTALTAAALLPTYLRKPQAEREREERMKEQKEQEKNI